jgi:Transposase, Mutator family
MALRDLRSAVIKAAANSLAIGIVGATLPRKCSEHLARNFRDWHRTNLALSPRGGGISAPARCSTRQSDERQAVTSEIAPRSSSWIALSKLPYALLHSASVNSPTANPVRARGHFPNDDAAMKLLYLVLNNAADEWKRPSREWFETKTQFAVVFGESFVCQ